MRLVYHSSGKTLRWSCFRFRPSIGMLTPAIMSGIVAGLNASVNLLIRQSVFFIVSLNTAEIADKTNFSSRRSLRFCRE